MLTDVDLRRCTNLYVPPSIPPSVPTPSPTPVPPFIPSVHSLRSFPPASDVDLVSLNDYYNALKIPTKAKVLKNVYAAYGKTWHIMSGNQQAPPMLAPPPQ